MAWWDCFLVICHGTSLFSPQEGEYVQVHSDAFGSFGCGAVDYTNHWLQIRWTDSWSTVDISAKEMVPVVLAAATWANEWYRSRVSFILITWQ